MFYVQHGYGKGLKIARLNDAVDLTGIILSPAHEDRLRLSETVTSFGHLELLLDPQSYIYSLTPQGTARHHASHGLALKDMHWSQTADTVKSHLEAVRLANDGIGLAGAKIAPAPYQSNLDNFWLPISLQYSRSSADSWGTDETLASLVVDEKVLESWDNIEGWLDVLTTLDVRGFYLVVNRNAGQYPAQRWDPQALSNLLRLIFTLTQLNDYELIWGYADIDGILGVAVGATGVASGWSYGLRTFNVSRWNVKRSGGAPAVPRIHFQKLWAPLRWNEAGDLHRTPEGRQAFTRTLSDHFANNSFESWGIAEAQHQHLEVLANRVNALARTSVISARLDRVQKSLDAALALHTSIASTGVTLDPRYVGQVRSYKEAMELFRRAESL